MRAILTDAERRATGLGTDAERRATGLGGRAAFVRQTPPTPVAASDLGLSVQLDRENYAPYDRPLVTAVLMNRSAAEIPLHFEYGLAHNDLERSAIFGVGGMWFTLAGS
ncbi:MAG: hypothetical protein HYV63_00200 [Candidatus Schekmanbacteria bacterium]|nr:hypothetical protein [Candidatus Schekmanbacteria bacterium]